jgi:DNA-binding MarR family transcriptional regulator
MDTLSKHCQRYKNAMHDKDIVILQQERNWLVSAVASAMLRQEDSELSALRGQLSELAALADRFDPTARPGDRWRALSEIMMIAQESSLPLEQLRLVLPNKLTGLMMKHIRQEPGITPAQLAQRCAKQPNHISNELKKLDKALLIHRLRQGRSQHLYLSASGKETLDSLATVQAGPALPRNYPHADTDRLKKLESGGKTPPLPWPEKTTRTIGAA